MVVLLLLPLSGEAEGGMRRASSASFSATVCSILASDD